MDYYNNDNYKYSDITKKIIKAAIEVHKKLGCGFPEVIYHRALVKEMKKTGLNFIRELTMKIMYDGEVIGARRVDFLVESKILVEIKAIELFKSLQFRSRFVD